MKAFDNIFGLKARFNSLRREGYTVLNDVEFKSVDGKKFHIDYFVLSQYGFFIINAINLNGTKFLNENDEHWKQVYKNKEITFINSVDYMSKIIVEIKKFFHKEFDDAYFNPIIVVNKMKRDLVSSSVHITQPDNLLPYINGFGHIYKITKKDIQDIMKQLEAKE
jgi:hypothetical protein